VLKKVRFFFFTKTFAFADFWNKSRGKTFAHFQNPKKKFEFTVSNNWNILGVFVAPKKKKIQNLLPSMMITAEKNHYLQRFPLFYDFLWRKNAF